VCEVVCLLLARPSAFNFINYTTNCKIHE
jgi:hypothetical protein